MQGLDLIVASAEVGAADVRVLELADPTGRPLPAFTAGAHVDLHLPNGLVRQYSLCNDPAQRTHYRLGVLRDPASRGGSQSVHELAVGQRVRVSMPRNHFPLSDAASHHLLLAGGIGITPLLSMAWQLAGRGQSFALHYCARSLDRMAFADALRGPLLGPHAHGHFDDGDIAQRLDLDAVVAACPADTHLYVCGPTGFIDWALSGARRAGWVEERLHREFFAAPAALASTATTGGFEVRIASTGQVIAVAPEQSVAAALRASGICIPLSCEQGLCGTCVVGILEGTPEHRDVFLTAEEQARGDRFTPCCSRARSPSLVLDL